ncbi:hypothetical protein ACFLZU_04090 [Thermodesulfobacteriota bacterium]
MEKIVMKTLLYLLLAVLAYGCAAGSPKTTAFRQETTELRHESAENALLTEEEFMDRAAQSATIIYEGLKAVDDAITRYTLDHNGDFPPGGYQEVRALLLEQGYLQEWPIVPAFAYTDPVQLDIRYYNNYQDADGDGVEDRIVFARELKLEVCEEFVRRYASPGFGDKVYDFQAAGKRYPGHTLGRHVKIYAINWTETSFSEACDIMWVVQYRERQSQPRKLLTD